MKFLADENFPGPIVEVLIGQSHDVVWAREACPSSKDSALLDRAETEGRIILTLDRDFWHLALQRTDALRQSGVVLFRVHPATPQNLRPLVDSMLEARHDWTQHVSVITPEGIEMFPVGGLG